MNSKMDMTTVVPETKTIKEIQNILITQHKPGNEKSPYFELARKYKVTLSFEPFIRVEPIPAKEFRKQKIDIASYSAVIFASRNAIDHFFRTCEEMRITTSQHTKYFCITESVALYLQKFILYRKRKVFFGSDGTNDSLFEVMSKYKDQERFLYPCSESFDSEITNWLIENNCDYATPVLYKVISNDVKKIIEKHNFEIICLLTPLGVRSFMENCPSFNQNGTLIGAFGDNTRKAVIAAGLRPDIIAPQPNMPSMVSALENYLSGLKKK
ncbi:MAG: uroporphyrinogen-III synthase [Bacteroidota bacterium]|nr:uroporphyrinogen-III synthase [Bacteroidota bacterium]